MKKSEMLLPGSDIESASVTLNDPLETSEEISYEDAPGSQSLNTHNGKNSLDNFWQLGGSETDEIMYMFHFHPAEFEN